MLDPVLFLPLLPEESKAEIYTPQLPAPNAIAMGATVGGFAPRLWSAAISVSALGIRRLTWLTNAFSKKCENPWAAYCLHFAYYNFCRIRKALRVTPAMETGITDHVWEIVELLA